ncbi:MAG: hypothetical protein JWP35_393 [Caulobacter sp.]|nr:hypothetical protein [Caulobacter sp.]
MPMQDLLSRLKAPFAAAAAALALAAPLALATPAAAEPALWVIKDADSTIYLFGTVHLLRKDVVWKSAKIAKAMADSQDLTLEIADLDPKPADLMPLIQKYGFDFAHPLSSKLSAEDNAKLAKVCALYGMAPSQLDPLRPWVAAVQLSLLPIVKAGYDPSAGVDRVLRAEAIARGEPVGGFETTEQQIAYFASLPPEMELEYLRQTLDQTDQIVSQLDALEGAWEAGDPDAIAKIMNEDMRKQAPALYALLLVHRNEDFAGQLKTKLAGHGVSFVAVGAAHLAGPDSVQAQLAKLGIKAKRV